MRLSVPFALLLFASLASAQEPASPAGAAPTQAVAPKVAPATGRITGTVYCADTRKPARGAMVMVIHVPSAGDGNGSNQGSVGLGEIVFSRAGMDGSYAAEHLKPGEYSVVAVLPGYLTVMDTMTGDMASADLRERLLQIGSVTVREAGTEHFDILLERGAAVSGRVFYSDGSPATQMSIALEAVKPDPKADADSYLDFAFVSSVFMLQSLNTDDQGRFRIAGLRPGSYRVAAVSLQGDTNNGTTGIAGMSGVVGALGDPGALRVYSGDTLHRKTATTYKLRPGDEVAGITITVPVDAFHHVRGTVAAKDGRAINNANLTMTDTADESISFKTKANSEGVFNFPNIPAGTYTLAASNAHIVVPDTSSDNNIPLQYRPTKPTNAFADGSVGILVKDADVLDVGITLTEVPMPAPPQQNPGSQP